MESTNIFERDITVYENCMATQTSSCTSDAAQTVGPDDCDCSSILAVTRYVLLTKWTDLLPLTAKSCLASCCTPAPTDYFSSLISVFCSSGAVPAATTQSVKTPVTAGEGSTSALATGAGSPTTTVVKAQPSSGSNRDWIPFLSGIVGLGIGSLALVL